MAHLHIGLFGSLHVTLDERPATAFGYDKVRALLIYLTLEAERPQTRDLLAGLLWPDGNERQAHRNLSQALLVLRHALADVPARQARAVPFLLVTANALQFNPAADADVDALAFAAAIAAGRTHAHTALAACPTCLNSLDAAVALFQGGLLPGFALDGCPEFEQWLLARQQHYQRLAAEALAALAAAYETRGEYAQCLAQARRWLALDPYQEEAHCQIMRGLALSGDRASALAHFDVCARLLQQDLNVEPSPATQALCASIRSGSGPSPATVLPSPNVPPGNLPAVLTPLIGRNAELEAVCRLLTADAARLVAIVGPGGAGKTRLAIAAAGQLRPAFPDGAYLIDLADVGVSVVPALAHVLALDSAGEVDPTQQLRDFLRSKRMLIVLDNVDVQPSRLEGMLTLLLAAPQVKVLATSRLGLNLQSEQIFPLGGLAQPPATGARVANPGPEPGVELFLHAARALRPGYSATPDDLDGIRAVCAAVEGLPLAILLAAAWIDVLTPQQIAARLVAEATHAGGLDLLAADWLDVPVRQQSMRAVMDHSWALLTDTDRRLLAQLSVLVGEFSCEAAQAVSDAGLRDLRRLVANSLLAVTPNGRYGLHLLVRQYVAEQRAAQPVLEGVARRRHSAYYAALAADRAGAVRAGHAAGGFSAIEADLGNIKAAWEYAADQGDAALLAVAADGYCGYYSLRGRHAEGLDSCERACRHLQPDSPVACLALAYILTWQATFERLLGRRQAALVHLQQCQPWLDSRELRRLYDLRSLRAFAMYEVGWLLAETDSLAAQRTWEEARVLCRETGDTWAISELNAAMEALAPLLSSRSPNRYGLHDFDL